MRRRFLLIVAVVATLGLVATACGGGEPAEPVEFGEGEVPESMPDSVPLPGGAVIGSTLIDRLNNRTEMALQARMEFEALVQFYSVELVGSGFLVQDSSGSASSWTIRFADGDLQGTVVISPAGLGVARAVVTVNRS
ncbi:MAG TPA: hypothetical protein VLD62_01545 [Acidimicrobiia bacterium]|nr:hypothetical protein [Acidimicrobiia bacterium]